MLEHLTSASAGGVWPTPTAKDSERSGNGSDAKEKWNGTLTDATVRMWGTPAAKDDQRSPEASMAHKESIGRTEVTSLMVQSKMWSSPRTTDFRPPDKTDHTGNRPSGTGGDLPSQATHWPTQRASMNENRTGKNAPSHGSSHGSTLAGMVSDWPTPTAHNAKGPQAGRNTDGLPTVVTTMAGPAGSPKVDLNPSFVAMLQGLPWDWLMHRETEVYWRCLDQMQLDPRSDSQTPSTSEGTGSSPSAPPQPSGSSSPELAPS